MSLSPDQPSATSSGSRWNALAENSQHGRSIHVDETTADLELPTWWAYSEFVRPAPNGVELRSEAMRNTLSRHPGSYVTNGERIDPAHVSVQIRQYALEREPYIHVERWAGVDGRRERIAGSEYRFTLDEAAELAHSLLLAVDAARGTTEEVA
ncbi:hypothetical protein [Rhodococcus sp. MTM3W5.2]|uniref:hypothetical protein n=1 Tax=Rhodococcus sp. MTM3W5.2 TaxID=1805827 RepID=UPI00097C0198|nr:hypothetical protein [Rhodococcus sp. MTM3W5.2]